MLLTCFHNTPQAVNSLSLIKSLESGAKSYGLLSLGANQSDLIATLLIPVIMFSSSIYALIHESSMSLTHSLSVHQSDTAMRAYLAKRRIAITDMLSNKAEKYQVRQIQWTDQIAICVAFTHSLTFLGQTNYFSCPTLFSRMQCRHPSLSRRPFSRTALLVPTCRPPS